MGKDAKGPFAHGEPWYFRVDEWCHEHIDVHFPWLWYWVKRERFCRYVDRRLGVSEEEMDRT